MKKMIKSSDFNFINTDWTKIASKSVPDSDGFTTDYTLYANEDETQFICMFGDRDIYEPDVDHADAVFDDINEAYEWFDSYEGLDEEEYY